MADPHVYFYGINGTRGGYLVDPLSTDTVAALDAAPDSAPVGVASAPHPASPVEEAPAPAPSDGRRWRTFDPNDPRFKPKPRVLRFRGWAKWVNPDDLASAGWAVIFPHDIEPAIVDALQPLLDLRRRQASAKEQRFFRCCCGADSYLPGDTAADFLARRGAGMGLADPKAFPYYVLLVGPPTRIPFHFQYELDSQYAVGRVAFDTPEEYAAYAQALVAAEKRTRAAGPVPVALFSTRHAGDTATDLSARYLVGGIEQHLGDPRLRCRVERWTGPDATKDAALRILGGDRKPALLFSATHGMAFERGDTRQRAHQGALVCHDDARPPEFGQRAEHRLAADDIGDSADVSGMIAFFFGCYTAGTPADGGALRTHVPGQAHASEEFLSRLPQRLLSHPRGGALAVVGHVDVAWSRSFLIPPRQPATVTFCSALEGMVEGQRVGCALEAFGQHGGQVAVGIQGDRQRGGSDAAYLLRSFEDARNYVLLGDPAVRLPPPAGGATSELTRPREPRYRTFDPALLKR